MVDMKREALVKLISRDGQVAGEYLPYIYNDFQQVTCWEWMAERLGYEIELCLL